MHAITSLLLDNMQLGDDGAYVLGQVPHLGSLWRLSVAHCGLGPQGVWDLTEGSGGLLDSLETLDISGNRFGDEGIRGLAVHPGLASLRTLIIGANDLSLAGMRMLALSPHLHTLIDLDLRRKRLHINWTSHTQGGNSFWMLEHRGENHWYGSVCHDEPNLWIMVDLERGLYAVNALTHPYIIRPDNPYGR